MKLQQHRSNVRQWMLNNTTLRLRSQPAVAFKKSWIRTCGDIQLHPCPAQSERKGTSHPLGPVRGPCSVPPSSLHRSKASWSQCHLEVAMFNDNGEVEHFIESCLQEDSFPWDWARLGRLPGGKWRRRKSSLLVWTPGCWHGCSFN